MIKKILSIVLLLGVLATGALAAAHPAPAVTSPIISGSGAEGNYYYLFVPDHAANQIRVIWAWNNEIGAVKQTSKDVATIPVSGGAVYGMAVNSDVSKLYVSIAGSSPNVSVYSISKTTPGAPTFTLEKSITGVSFPMGMALSPDNKYLYVADSTIGKVHVIETQNNSIKGAISVGGVNLTDVAVKPDNTRLAVSRTFASGAVYIYDITSVPTTIPSTPIYTVTSGMENPTYLSYMNDGRVLFVKVNQTTSPYYDVIGLNTDEGIYGGFGAGSSNAYTEGASLSMVSADEYHPNNKWDGMALSLDDSYIYLTHYRTSIDPLVTTDDGIYGYAIKVKGKLGIGMKYTDSDKDGKDDSGLGWQIVGPIVYNEGFDSTVGSPNGGYVWFASSVKGHVEGDTLGTGYDWKLNTPPGAVSNLQVVPPTAGTKLKWSAALDDGNYTTNSGKKMAYVIEYKTAANLSWQTDLGNVESNASAIEKDITTLSYGTTYYFRVKAYDGGDANDSDPTKRWDDGKFGPYAVIGPVTAGKDTPVIPPTTSNIIDDIEGKLVLHTKYYKIIASGEKDPTFKPDTSTKHEGSYSMATNYDASTAGYRGWGGELQTNFDFTKYDTINFYMQGDGSTTGNVKLQLKDDDNSVYGTSSTAYEFAISDSSGFKKYSIPVSAFNKSFAAGTNSKLDTDKIAEYQFIFTDKNASKGKIYIDYVTASKELGPIVTSIKRDGDTKGSSVTVSWTVTPSGNVDIYTVEAYSTDASKWKAEKTNYTSSSTGSYTDKSSAALVGSGYQKYYKVVATGTTLTSTLLKKDVVGKFDVSLKKGYNLISLPFEVADTSIAKVIGAQLTAGTVPPLADKIYKFKDSTSGYEQVWLNSTDKKWYDATTMKASTITVAPDAGYWVELASGTAVTTLVGNISEKDRSIKVQSGFNFVGTTFPIAVTLGSENLSAGASMGSVPPLSAKIYNFKDSTSGFEQVWLKSTDKKWYDATSMKLSTMKLSPGKGYIVEEIKGKSSYTWLYKKPY
ncbi:MAG: hypothetical protein HQ564_06805 [Candidatus Saganbacteria bacterium]|nr:hypothetical protein [Candidatus Saganbacteria bacterium]